MKRNVGRILLVTIAALFSIPILIQADAVVRTSADNSTIGTAINQFQADLGGANNGNTPGPLGSGFRTINWDGVPDPAASPNNLAPDFFAGRGAIFSTDGTGFQVSASTASGTPVRFGNIDPTYSSTFSTFSPERLFTPVGGNTMDISFVVPGMPSMSAWVRGFGAAFADVDDGSSTMLDFLDATGESVFSLSVPANPNGLSFAGVSFNAGEQIARIRLTFGNNPLGTGIRDGGGLDLVVGDDFVFSEPQPVPEPGVVALLAVVALSLLCRFVWSSAFRRSPDKAA